MEQLIQNWGLEILFALISATVVGYFKYQGNKLKKKLTDYETMLNEK